MPQSGVQLKLDRGGGVSRLLRLDRHRPGLRLDPRLIVAEVLGIDPFDIRVVTGDTDLTPVDLGSLLQPRDADDRQRRDPGGRARARAARRRPRRRSSRSRRSASGFAEGRVFDVENPEKGMTFRRGGRPRRVEVSARSAPSARTRRRRPPAATAARASGRRRPTPTRAAVAEVEVDPETGIVTVPKIWIAHDIGKCINPAARHGPGRGLRLHGPRRGADGGDGLSHRREPQRRPQVPVDARVQEPDDDGDVRRRDLPRRGPRSERPLRREGSRPGAAPADSCRPSRTRSTTPSACASTRSRSRPRRCCGRSRRRRRARPRASARRGSRRFRTPRRSACRRRPRAATARPRDAHGDGRRGSALIP